MLVSEDVSRVASGLKQACIREAQTGGEVVSDPYYIPYYDPYSPFIVTRDP